MLYRIYFNLPDLSGSITRGCNPPTGDRYCPDRPLTRAEFAAFLHRAAQLDS